MSYIVKVLLFINFMPKGEKTNTKYDKNPDGSYSTFFILHVSMSRKSY